MSPRVPKHQYLDPLDQIWIAAAARIGLSVRRDDAVYAGTDGRGTLTIGSRAELDPDDCLAQLIFHELCHSLIEGAASFKRTDWGLDNTTERDVPREHACLRLQAELATPYGLRDTLAPTTEHRAFYDKLGDDPLRPTHVPSVVLAMHAHKRAHSAPWAPHLANALSATRAIATLAAAATENLGDNTKDPNALTSLWSTVQEPPAPHPVGSGRYARADGTCAACAWYYEGGQGRAVPRCRSAGDARIEPAWPACQSFEPVLDCCDCGACCREAYHSVTVSRRDPAVALHPDFIVDRGNYLELARTGDRCSLLSGGTYDAGTFTPFGCDIYDTRPRPCREFESGGANCIIARRRVGLSR